MWPYSQQDIWLAVPADWCVVQPLNTSKFLIAHLTHRALLASSPTCLFHRDAPPITHTGPGRWAGAFLTHDSMEVVGMAERDPRDLHPPARLRRPGPVLEAKAGHYEAERLGAAAPMSASRGNSSLPSFAGTTSKTVSKATAKIVSHAADAATKAGEAAKGGAVAVKQAHRSATLAIDSAIRSLGVDKWLVSTDPAAANRTAAVPRPFRSKPKVFSDPRKGGGDAADEGAAEAGGEAWEVREGEAHTGLPPRAFHKKPKVRQAPAAAVPEAAREMPQVLATEATTQSAAATARAQQPRRLVPVQQGTLDDDDYMPPPRGLDLSAGTGQDDEAGDGLLEEVFEGGSLLGIIGLFVWCASGGTLVGLCLCMRRLFVTRGRSMTRMKHLKAEEKYRSSA